MRSRRIVGRLGEAADEDPRPAGPCDRGERLRVLAGDRTSRGAEPVVVAAVLEVLGEGDQARAGRGGFGRQIGGAADVRGHVIGGIELDQRDGELHPPILATRQRIPVSYDSSTGATDPSTTVTGVGAGVPM